MRYLLIILFSILASTILTSITIWYNTKRQKNTGKTPFEMKNTKGHRIAQFIFYFILGIIYFSTTI